MGISFDNCLEIWAGSKKTGRVVVVRWVRLEAIASSHISTNRFVCLSFHMRATPGHEVGS